MVPWTNVWVVHLDEVHLEGVHPEEDQKKAHPEEVGLVEVGLVEVVLVEVGPDRVWPGLEPPRGGPTGGVTFGALPPERGRPAQRADASRDTAASGGASAPPAPAVSTKRKGIKASRCLAGAILAQ
jgi:hypothetical protein